jgi:SAM-dependent methyltransferase
VNVFARAGTGLAHWEAARAPDVAGLIRRHAPPDTGVALDLGCGTGAVARALAGAFDRIVALDPAVRPVARDVWPVAADAVHLPLRDASVDLVYSYGVLHHVPLGHALAEVRRVLRPGGTVVVADFLAREGVRRRPVWEALRASAGYRRRLGLRAALRITAYRLRPSWLRHVRADRFLSIAEFRRRYGEQLPGVEITDEGTRAVAVWTSRGTP